MSNCPDRETRRRWVLRILDHDGYGDQEGGIEAWARLGDAVGLTRDELWSLKLVAPGVRFAVDAYVNFARRAPWQEAVCSSLTEMFAPQIHKDRLATWPEHYPWIEPVGLAYFRSRITLAQRDVEHGLEVTLDSFQATRTAGTRARNPAVQARHPLDHARFHRKGLSPTMSDTSGFAPSLRSCSACNGNRRRTRTSCSIPKAW